MKEILAKVFCSTEASDRFVRITVQHREGALSRLRRRNIEVLLTHAQYGAAVDRNARVAESRLVQAQSQDIPLKIGLHLEAERSL